MLGRPQQVDDDLQAGAVDEAAGEDAPAPEVDDGAPGRRLRRPAGLDEALERRKSATASACFPSR
jgi:hypothetical protein